MVEGAIGEFSSFHTMHGIYAEGIHRETAALPAGWQERLVTWPLLSSDPATPFFLDPHDLAVSKLIAARPKDIAFVDALLHAGLVEARVLLERARLITDEEALRRSRVIEHLNGYLPERGGHSPIRGAEPGRLVRTAPTARRKHTGNPANTRTLRTVPARRVSAGTP